MTTPASVPSAGCERFFPRKLREAEEALIARRRQHAELEGEREHENIGIACSGGGIRSATFCLGFFQAVAKGGLLAKVDYVSTISGGGYFGSFLGSLFVHGPTGSSTPPPADSSGLCPNAVHARAVLSDTQSGPIE
jgi:hypothetical protein